MPNMNSHPNALTHNEMLARARQIHPDAILALDEHTNQWDIIIKTSFPQKEELDPEFEGTPAWELFHTFDSTYGDCLARWMWKNLVSGSLHEGATAYNGQERAAQQHNEKFYAALREADCEGIMEKMNRGELPTQEEAARITPIWERFGW